jgi:hypothetical protein
MKVDDFLKDYLDERELYYKRKLKKERFAQETFRN